MGEGLSLLSSASAISFSRGRLVAATGGEAQTEEFVKVTGLLVVSFRTVQKREKIDATGWRSRCRHEEDPASHVEQAGESLSR